MLCLASDSCRRDSAALSTVASVLFGGGIPNEPTDGPADVKHDALVIAGQYRTWFEHVFHENRPDPMTEVKSCGTAMPRFQPHCPSMPLPSWLTCSSGQRPRNTKTLDKLLCATRSLTTIALINNTLILRRLIL